LPLWPPMIPSFSAIFLFLSLTRMWLLDKSWDHLLETNKWNEILYNGALHYFINFECDITVYEFIKLYVGVDEWCDNNTLQNQIVYSLYFWLVPLNATTCRPSTGSCDCYVVRQAAAVAQVLYQVTLSSSMVRDSLIKEVVLEVVPMCKCQEATPCGKVTCWSLKSRHC